MQRPLREESVFLMLMRRRAEEKIYVSYRSD